jgi:hypothetical protein
MNPTKYTLLVLERKSVVPLYLHFRKAVVVGTILYRKLDYDLRVENEFNFCRLA